MSRTTDLPFNGGAVVDPSGETSSAQVHTVFLRKINIVDAGHELPVYAMFDKDKPTTVAPFFEPVSAFTLAEWCTRGDVIQVDLSEAIDSQSNSYSGLIQEVTLDNDAESGPYVSECTLRTMVKRGSTGVRFSWFWLCLVMDQNTGITYLATPVLNNPITIDVPDHKVQVEQTDAPGYLVNKISGDGETINVDVVRQNALGDPIDPFLKISSRVPQTTPLEGYSDYYGIGIKTNKFGQVTEVTTGTQLGFNVHSGRGHSGKTLTAEEIAQGYFDIHIGLPRLSVGGRSITPEFVDVSNMVINVGLSDAMFDSDGNCSVLKAEVLFDFVNDDIEYFTKFICSVDDFKKDEFGRNLPADFFYSNFGKYVYSFLRTTRTDQDELYIKGFILRCYINTAFIDSDPPAPGDFWFGPHVDIYVTSISNTMLGAIRNTRLVTTPNTLRFEFSDLNYSPVVAGVGTSGTWTKRTEYSIPASTGYVRNIWDWTNDSSDWNYAFEYAWTSEDMDVELVAAGDTSAVTSVHRLFEGCSALKSAIAFDTSSVTLFASMFEGCTQLSGVPYFNTGSAINVRHMFDGCTKVRSGALALYTSMSGQTSPPDHHDEAFKDCGKDTTEGLAELQQIPTSWGGLAP